MSLFFPNGHFYSPVVNIEEVKQATPRIWPENPQVLGIDFNDASHELILTQAFPQYIADYDYPLEKMDESHYYINNPQFSWLDAKMLFVLLRHFKPKNMIELGSGYSSLLTADVNRRFLNQALNFICIEPYPPEFLTDKVSGVTRLFPNKVEELPLSTFASLQSDDILFIDSSHVSKTGSDVNFIYFEILPRLAPGVIIHIHDIFLPADYPKEWVIDEGRSWNEQYIVRALLMFSNTFEVVFGCYYAASQHTAWVKQALGGECYGGGSLWIRKVL